MTAQNTTSEILNTWILFEGIMRSTMMSGTLTHREFAVCNTVADAKGDITATMLCDRLVMHKSQMNRTLQKLEDNGMIIRERSESDKRNIYIRLNPDGCARFLEMRARALAYTDKVIDILGRSHASRIKQSFDEVIDALGKVTAPSGKE